MTDLNKVDILKREHAIALNKVKVLQREYSAAVAVRQKLAHEYYNLNHNDGFTFVVKRTKNKNKNKKYYKSNSVINPAQYIESSHNKYEMLKQLHVNNGNNFPEYQLGHGPSSGRKHFEKSKIFYDNDPFKPSPSVFGHHPWGDYNSDDDN